MSTNINILSEKVKLFAKNIFDTKEVSKEWMTIIILTCLLYVGTMVVSIFSSHFWLENIISPLFDNKSNAIIPVIIVLALGEILTAIFINKTIKFVLKHEYKIAAITGVFGLCLYIYTFKASSEGLALRQSVQVDNTVRIKHNTEKTISEIKADYGRQISYIDDKIQVIKKNPAGWSEGRRSHLTAEQQKDIEKYNNLIEKKWDEMHTALVRIDESHKNKLQKNQAIVDNTASKYYRIVSIVMLIQVLANFIITFFLYQIYAEKHQKSIIEENIKNQARFLEKTTGDLAQQLIYNRISMIIGVINELTDINALDTKAARQIGFNTNSANDGTNNIGSSIRIEGAQDNLLYTEYLKKYPAVIASIKKNMAENLEKIPNDPIDNVIVPETGKSRTLIREIYKAMNIIGFNNFDDNGNIIQKGGTK